MFMHPSPSPRPILAHANDRRTTTRSSRLSQLDRQLQHVESRQQYYISALNELRKTVNSQPKTRAEQLNFLNAAEQVLSEGSPNVNLQLNLLKLLKLLKVLILNF